MIHDGSTHPVMETRPIDTLLMSTRRGPLSITKKCERWWCWYSLVQWSMLAAHILTQRLGLFSTHWYSSERKTRFILPYVWQLQEIVPITNKLKDGDVGILYSMTCDSSTDPDWETRPNDALKEGRQIWFISILYVNQKRSYPSN